MIDVRTGVPVATSDVRTEAPMGRRKSDLLREESAMSNVVGIIVSLVAGFSIDQAVAAPLANPGALKVAIEDAGLIEQVQTRLAPSTVFT
jgi:hypothetical protein